MNGSATPYRPVLLAALLVLGAAGCRPQESVAPEGVQPAGGVDPVSRTTAGRPITTVDPARLREAIHKAAGYIIRSCDERGQFVYKINLNPDVPVEPQYNILRHAGTIYALGMYHQWQPNDPTREAMLRAADFLKRTSVGPLPGHDDMSAVWSHPEIARTDRPLQAKLGGAGLGLVALLSLEQLSPGSTPLEDLRRLGRFIVFMQKPDGGFYAKFVPSQGGRDDQWISLYYPGEAALGLLMLYEKDPSPVWLDAAAKCIAYLARSRRDKRVVEADHWALLATARLLALVEADHPDCSRQVAVRHAEQISQGILSAIPRYPPHLLAEGCMTPDGRTCPAATRLEGLSATLTFLPEEHDPLRRRMATAIEGGIAFLVRAQVPGGPHAGAVTRSLLRSADFSQLPASQARDTEVRIDYVQHALSAMIQHERMLAKPQDLSE